MGQFEHVTQCTILCIFTTSNIIYSIFIISNKHHIIILYDINLDKRSNNNVLPISFE